MCIIDTEVCMILYYQHWSVYKCVLSTTSVYECVLSTLKWVYHVNVYYQQWVCMNVYYQHFSECKCVLSTMRKVFR